MPSYECPNLRRLPVYLLLDCSDTMAGGPITAVDLGLRSLIRDVQADPQALETVWLSVISFSSTATQQVPLAELAFFPSLALAASGTCSFRNTIRLLHDCMQREVRITTMEEKGDWKPLVIVLLGSLPTDEWEDVLQEFRESRRANIITCAVGPAAAVQALGCITDVALRLESTSRDHILKLFHWISDSIIATAQSCSEHGDRSISLPALPDSGLILESH